MFTSAGSEDQCEIGKATNQMPPAEQASYNSHPLLLLRTLAFLHISNSVFDEELHVHLPLLLVLYRDRPQIPHILIVDSARLDANPLRCGFGLIPKATPAVGAKYEGIRFPLPPFVQ